MYCTGRRAESACALPALRAAPVCVRIVYFNVTNIPTQKEKLQEHVIRASAAWRRACALHPCPHLCTLYRSNRRRLALMWRCALVDLASRTVEITMHIVGSSTTNTSSDPFASGLMNTLCEGCSSPDLVLTSCRLCSAAAPNRWPAVSWTVHEVR